MKTLCQNCHTAYDLPKELEGRMGCPYCEHVNIPNARTEPKKTGPPVFKPNTDQNRTMIGFVYADQKDETTAVKRVSQSGDCIAPPADTHFLICLDEKEGKRKIPITKGKTTLGRKGCDIVLKDQSVSRMHCVIECYGEKIILKDLESANGTLLNRKIVQEDFLNDQDEIQLGETRLKFIRIR